MTQYIFHINMFDNDKVHFSYYIYLTAQLFGGATFSHAIIIAMIHTNCCFACLHVSN